MNANKLMALLGLEYPTTSRYKELHAVVTQALEDARVEGALDCCMTYDCERLKPKPAEPVQKLRPDFIAGYDAGMKDMMRRVKAEIAEQPLPEPQPEPVAWMYLYRRHDGTVIRRMEGGRWNGDDAFEQVPLYTHPPAPTTQKVCHGIPRIGCNYLAECDSICNKCGQLHAVQFIPPAPTTQEPVAWLAAYVNSEGLPDQYVTTHHELAVENDANGAPKPLFFNPPTTHEPMAWIDSMGHPHHLSAIQGVREKQLYGPWRPLYD